MQVSLTRCLHQRIHLGLTRPAILKLCKYVIGLGIPCHYFLAFVGVHVSEFNKIVDRNVASELPSFGLLDFNLAGNLIGDQEGPTVE